MALRGIETGFDDRPGLGRVLHMGTMTPWAPQSRMRVASCGSCEVTRAVGVIPMPNAATHTPAAVSSSISMLVGFERRAVLQHRLATADLLQRQFPAFVNRGDPSASMRPASLQEKLRI